MMELPVIDLEEYLVAREPGDNARAETKFKKQCQEVASCLRDTGALVIRDPRCTTEDNDRFLDMMEKYWGQSEAFKRQQERPEVFYQVGVTPEGIETPRCLFDQHLQERMSALSEDARPHVPSGADPKWRYMWRFGPRPANTRFQELSSDPVIPEGFPEWQETLNTWGQKMISAVEVVSEMAAIGFGLPKTAFTSLMKDVSSVCDTQFQQSQGPHILAPTGCDLSKYGNKGTVFAGYHYDLNFLTIHGRSRFPGLYIWLKDGRKVPVSVPLGCLLLQAGKELEWLTGGECSAGMHEVVVTEKTVEAINAAREAGRSLWRVSSTVFGHIAYDAVLQPLGHFAGASRAHLYSPIFAGDYVKSELSVIKLKGKMATGAHVAPLSA